MNILSQVSAIGTSAVKGSPQHRKSQDFREEHRHEYRCHGERGLLFLLVLLSPRLLYLSHLNNDLSHRIYWALNVRASAIPVTISNSSPFTTAGSADSVRVHGARVFGGGDSIAEARHKGWTDQGQRNGTDRRLRERNAAREVPRKWFSMLGSSDCLRSLDRLSVLE
jgi:hypothetical protein